MRALGCVAATLLCALPTAAGAASSGECLLVPTMEGPNGVAECLDETAAVPYALELALPAEEASRRLLGCQLVLQLEGLLTKSSKEALTSSGGVVETAKTIFSKPLGKVLGGSIAVEGRACSHEWGCRTVTVHDSHRFWQLDCEGVVNKPGDQVRLLLGGVKRYKVTVITDALPEAATPSKGFISMRLLGEDGSQSSDLTLLAAARTPGIAYSAEFTATDVGSTIKQINVTNHTPNDPWRFKTITITTADGTIAKFGGAQYIGTPYASSLVFRNSYFTSSDPNSTDATDASDPTPIYIECHTRLVDIISGSANQPFTMKVHCPAGCDSSPLSFVVGLTLHPAVSSVCASAVADGAIGVSGGLLQLQLYPSDFRDLSALYLNVSRIVVHPYRDDPTSPNGNMYYTATRITSLDDLDAYLRIVDLFGELSHTGRLEMRSADGTWGSVCTHGDTEQFSPEAAKVACREVGFLWGSVLDGTCGSMNLCAPATMPILAGGITCKGDEDKFGDCAIQEPAAICHDHTHDVLIHCSDTPPTLHPPSGTLRLVDSGGMPAIRGIGRLEMFVGHDWGTICDDGWTRTDAGVACREMGFTSVKDSNFATSADEVVSGGANASDETVACDNLMGTNYCGAPTQRIVVTDVNCDGGEGRLRDCGLSAPEDVYCVHSEDVVIGCDGPGDPSGVGLFAAEHAPHLTYLYLKPTRTIRCTDTFTSLFAKSEPRPSELYIVRCPTNCARSKGSVVGTYIYSWDSSVCRSALHAGMIDDTGMVVGVVAGHGQYRFPPSIRRGIQSEDGQTAENSFHTVRITEDLSSRMPLPSSTDSKAQAGGFSLLDPAFMLARENFKRPFTMDELAGRTDDSGALSFLQTSSAQIPVPLVAFCNEGNILARFDGSANGQIALNSLPGGSALSALESFTIIIRFRPTSEKRGWRSLMSYGECDGFNLVLDNENQVVFEQLCTPLVINTKVTARLNIWTYLAVVFDSARRTLFVFDNKDEKISNEIVSQIFRWTSILRIGKSSTLEYEPFVGEISHVLVYNYPLRNSQGGSSNADVLSFAIDHLADTCMRLSPMEPTLKYSTQNYRLCMSDCAGGAGSKAAARKQLSRIDLASAPAVPIDCYTTLDNTPALSSKLNQEIEVMCPLSCFTNTTLDRTASKLDAFPGVFPICKAAQNLGFVPAKNEQRIKIKILPGRRTYLPAHLAPTNLDPSLVKTFGQCKDIRSYTVLSITEPRTIPCSATAEFLMFAAATDTHLFRCPAGCKGSSKVNGDSQGHHEDSRAVEQLKFAAPAKGLLNIRDSSEPICRAAVDEGLLTTRAASDVLVHLIPAHSLSTPSAARSKSDVLHDVMAGLQLPFADSLPARADHLDIDWENDNLVFGSELSIDNRVEGSSWAKRSIAAYQLKPMLLSVKCGDVVVTMQDGDDIITDLTDLYYCDGPAVVSGMIQSVPAMVRVPQLGLSILFDEDRCVSGDLMQMPDTQSLRSAPRNFHVNIFTRADNEIESWMEVGASAIACRSGSSHPASSFMTDGRDVPYTVGLVGDFSSIAIQRLSTKVLS